MLDVALSALVTLLRAGDAGYGVRLAIIIDRAGGLPHLHALLRLGAPDCAHVRAGRRCLVLRVLGMLPTASSLQFATNGIAAIGASLS